RGIVVLRGFDQRAGVFRKARSTEAWPRMKEFRSDAIVQSDAACNFLYIRADLVGQIRDFVYEGDLGGEKSVCRVFDEFRSTATREYERALIEIERPVDFRNDFAGAFVLCTDYDPVRNLEIADRRALTQELWIGGHGDISRWVRFVNKSFHFVACPNRNSRLGYHHREAFDCSRDLPRHRVNIAKIGMTIAAAGGVPTAINTASASRTGPARSVSKFSRPFLTLFC